MIANLKMRCKIIFPGSVGMRHSPHAFHARRNRDWGGGWN